MASGSGGVHSTSVGSTRHGDLGAAGGDAGGFDVGRGRGVDHRLGVLARRAVAADGLTGERSGSTDVASTCQREERDRGQHDHDADGDGDHGGCTHDGGVSL